MQLRRSVTVTPKFLALVFPVRIGAAQQNAFVAKFGKRDGLKIHSHFRVAGSIPAKGTNGPGPIPGT